MHEKFISSDLRAARSWYLSAIMQYWYVCDDSEREEVLRKHFHSRDVEKNIVLLDADEYGLGNFKLDSLRATAYLHDVGRLAEIRKHKSILLKHTSFDHAWVGAEWLRVDGPDLDNKDMIIDAVAHHSDMYPPRTNPLTAMLQAADKLALMDRMEERYGTVIQKPSPVSDAVLTRFLLNEMIPKSETKTPSDYLIVMAAWFNHLKTDSARSFVRATELPQRMITMITQSLGNDPHQIPVIAEVINRYR